MYLVGSFSLNWVCTTCTKSPHSRNSHTQMAKHINHKPKIYSVCAPRPCDAVFATSASHEQETYISNGLNSIEMREHRCCARRVINLSCRCRASRRVHVLWIQFWWRLGNDCSSLGNYNNTRSQNAECRPLYLSNVRLRGFRRSGFTETS